MKGDPSNLVQALLQSNSMALATKTLHHCFTCNYPRFCCRAYTNALSQGLNKGALVKEYSTKGLQQRRPHTGASVMHKYRFTIQASKYGTHLGLPDTEHHHQRSSAARWQCTA